jgi:hypothetical protein
MRLVRHITLVMRAAHSSPVNTAVSLEPRRFGMWSRPASSLKQQNCEAMPSTKRPNPKLSSVPSPTQQLWQRLGAGVTGPRFWAQRLLPPLRWSDNLRFRLCCAVVLARTVCRILRNFDFREPLHTCCVDLGDAVLEGTCLTCWPGIP